MRADSGFYAHAVVAMCRKMGVRFSITARQHKGLRALIEAIPEDAWVPIPYWLEGGADVAATVYTPFAGGKDARSVRLIVRRVRPTSGSQLALFALCDHHPFITDREGTSWSRRPTTAATRRSRTPSGTSRRVSASTTCRQLFGLPGRLTRSARKLTLHLPARRPWAEAFQAGLARLRAIPIAT